MKKDQKVFLTCLKTREERVKELEEKDVKVEEDSEEKSKVKSKYIETSEKAIQTQSIDANVSNHELATYVRMYMYKCT